METPIEKSAEERWQEIATKKMADEIVQEFREFAEAHGMTFEQACALLRRQLDESAKLRREMDRR
jgi:hypothetical protein